MTTLRVAVPNKGSLSEAATEILEEAGYPGRGESKSLSVADKVNGIEFYFLRPKDIPVYVGNGHLDLGITGRDLAADSLAPVDEVLTLGFGASTFRYAAPANEEWGVEDLAGKRIATSYPNLVREDLKARGMDAEVIRLDGAVEIAIRLGVADAIADVVETGNTLKAAGMETFGEPIMTSEAILISGRGQHPEGLDRLIRRLQGVLVAAQYVMMDYDVHRDLLPAAAAITPGLESPTISPLADENWVAVRSMVPAKKTNQLMDELYELGARAILVSSIHACRI